MKGGSQDKFGKPSPLQYSWLLKLPEGAMNKRSITQELVQEKGLLANPPRFRFPDVPHESLLHLPKLKKKKITPMLIHVLHL